MQVHDSVFKKIMYMYMYLNIHHKYMHVIQEVSNSVMWKL